MTPNQEAGFKLPEEVKKRMNSVDDIVSLEQLDDVINKHKLFVKELEKRTIGYKLFNSDCFAFCRGFFGLLFTILFYVSGLAILIGICAAFILIPAYLLKTGGGILLGIVLLFVTAFCVASGMVEIQTKREQNK